MPKVFVSYSDYKYKNNEESIVKIKYDGVNYFTRECFLFELKKFAMIHGRFLTNETLHKAHSFSVFSGCEINLTNEEFSELEDILKDRTEYEKAEMNNFHTSFPLISKFIRQSPKFWEVE